MKHIIRIFALTVLLFGVMVGLTGGVKRASTTARSARAAAAIR
jgi:hypothetical protein